MSLNPDPVACIQESYDNLASDGAATGMDDHVTKPVRLAILGRALVRMAAPSAA